MATWLQQFRNVLCVCIILNSNHFPSCVLTFAEPLWTDRGLKSGISVCELISTLKKKKNGTGGEWMVEHSSKMFTREEDAHHHDYFLSTCLPRTLIVITAVELWFSQLGRLSV